MWKLVFQLFSPRLPAVTPLLAPSPLRSQLTHTIHIGNFFPVAVGVGRSEYLDYTYYILLFLISVAFTHKLMQLYVPQANWAGQRCRRRRCRRVCAWLISQCLLMLPAARPGGSAANGISAQINLIKSFSLNCLVNNCPISLALTLAVCLGNLPFGRVEESVASARKQWKLKAFHGGCLRKRYMKQFVVVLLKC